MAKSNNRIDHLGNAQTQLRKNAKRIYATQTICALCGRPVDFTKKFPDPLSPTVDHIIPISKGGHPFAMENLQLAHFICNREKSDKLSLRPIMQKEAEITNSNLPQSADWISYKGE
jgi:5-methylcytosine-specific restriction endonuclease McrA